MLPILLFRADASPAIGVGHVMRCLALAQAWQDTGGCAVFIRSEMPDRLVTRLEHEDLTPVRIHAQPGTREDAEATVGVARRKCAEWIVVDGARFGSEYYDVLRAAGLKMLALDDDGSLERYPVDMLLNQNLSGTPALYAGKIDANATLLLGPRHALLRREFRACESWRRPPVRNPRRILVTFGGGDQRNLTTGVLQNLARTGRTDFQVVALVGATNPHLADLKQVAAGLKFRCELRIDVDDVAEVMTWADVAVASAGSTVWELAALSLPAIVCDIEDGQLARLGALDSLPLFRVWRPRDLESMDLAAGLDSLLAQPPAKSGIDVRGADRVAAALQFARAGATAR